MLKSLLVYCLALMIAGTAYGSELKASGKVDRPIRGWVEFCEKYPAECKVNPGEPEIIQHTPQSWDTMLKINQLLNYEIKPISDLDHWGRDDVWDLAEDGSGDCEDIQLLKRKRLVEAGFPRRALRLSVVIDEDGTGHAVLLALTTQGTFVLDNRRDAVLHWNQTGYEFISREANSGDRWVYLVPSLSPTTVASR
jgi:predicted transglutaminase-like cysteine proteinase